MLKKLWNDPVWSKVIATAIIAMVAVPLTYFLDWWTSIGTITVQCLTFILASTAIPNWLIFFLGLFALPAVGILGVFIWGKISPPQPSVPAWKTYTTDIFFGLCWRWKYESNGEIYGAHTFCPHCDYQVYAQHADRFRDSIVFLCDSCGRNLGQFQGTTHELESKAKRFIQQKIRNNTWQPMPPTQ